MIKLYEEYEQYYTKISYREYFGYTTEIDFDESIINYLTNIYKDIINFTYKEAILILQNSVTPIYIYELPDEWFLVGNVGDNNHQKYYKCDQLEGLIKCLQIDEHE